MQVNQTSAIETVHRLLFRALLEIRSQGHDEKNKVVFHLADLFHTVVLEMEKEFWKLEFPLSVWSNQACSTEMSARSPPMNTATRQGRTPLGLFPDRPIPRLYDCIVEVLRVRHYSRRTEEAYVHWIRRYIEFHQHRHPRQLAETDVNRFLTSLAVKGHVAASRQNQALSAILFLNDLHARVESGRTRRPQPN